ncbi:unnamed protein product [Linum tenue]|uniref:ent-kaurene synthase n=1 Tax=Linum tenue TaxID=586396 RepID=A0AAV0H0W0_9ROSI|nr:unnamed protein product [Linum tenue]
MFVCFSMAGSQPPMSSNSVFPLVPAAIPATCRESGSLLTTEFSNTNLFVSYDDSRRIQRIKKMFDEAQLSVSAYDTAWMAMVPTPTSSMEDSPFFPQCARWILDNQLSDGSWGLPLPRRDPSLIKDALSSTLACILALQRWGLGEQQVTKGIRFLDFNSASLKDQKQHVPIGFDIIFPGMIDYAKDLGLNLPFKSTDVDAMLAKRNVELTSGFGRNAEGRRAYLAYVSEGIQHSQDWDMVMKYQRQNGSLFNSPSTTAVAFSHIQDPDCLRYLYAVLDKFENAAPAIYPLDIRSRLSVIDTLDSLGVARHFTNEIKMLLDKTYQCWLQGDEDIFLDTTTCAMAFRLLRVYGYDVSSADDFNLCQSIQKKELKQLGRWIIENKLDKLSFARQKLGYCYFSAAATLYAPELSDARFSWAKNGVLTTVVDDFFDVGGSMEELVNLVQLLENWEVDGSTDFCSEQVEILFTAIRGTIREIGDMALARQGRDVTRHINDIWVELVKSMLKEAEWSKNKCVPTMEEYMKNARVSFALGPIVLPALYLVGPKLSEEMVSSAEYKNLYEGMSTCGRLLNDWRGCSRDSEQGTVNAVSLLLLEGGRTLDDAVEEVREAIEKERKQLLRLVLLEKEEKGMPKCCKQLFWNMAKVLHLFYMKDDGFTNEDIVNVAKSIVNEPIHLAP